MKVWTKLLTGAALAATVAVFAVPSEADVKKELSAFKAVWGDKKKSTREKFEAVQALPTGDEGLAATYIEILETDVWQYRADVALNRIVQENNEALLAELSKFLFDEKKAPKQPSAAEHLVLALYNNQNFANAANWAKLGDIVNNEKMPSKVKRRAIRELGRWRGAEEVPAVQTQMKANAGLLISLLKTNLANKKADRIERFLLIDSLESLTSEEHEESIENWEYWYNSVKDAADKPLTPRKAQAFKDNLGDIELEGHSFVRKGARKAEGMEILILPEFAWSEEYWYPYIFELNKFATCTFVELPDASRVKGLKRPTDRSGNADPNAYYYPLEQLVEAFEERRKLSKQEKVGIIAHGVSGWIALEYCRLHPESVAFAIIMNTWSGNQSFGKARNQMEGNKAKDDDMKFYGAGLVYDPTNRQGYSSFNDDQKFHYHTGEFKRMQADPKSVDSLMYGAIRSYRKPIAGGQALVPEYEFENQMKNKTLNVPVLFIHGEMDGMFVQDDVKLYQKVFKNGMFETFKGTSRTPWAEEPTLFYEKFNTLMEKAGIVAKEKDKK
jgi:pimeloyl-ACP methyl ester carboxylesterase